MQKISLQKKSFFNSIGLDINNLPAELQIKSNSIQTKIPKEDLKFLNNQNLTVPKEKYFRLKNLYGTTNLKLDNKTWIDIFSDSEKTDEIVKLYFKNPNYYFKDLKQLDQSTLKHNNCIELFEDNGKFFVKDGLARLSVVMIKYLLEMSRAQSKEEKIMINKQYTYAAVVRSAPKDVDIMYLINMLFEIYGQEIKLQKIDNDNECSYIMKYEDKKIEIKDKADFEEFIKNGYLPKDCKSKENFKAVLKNITKVGMEYKDNEDKVDQFLVMGKLFPNYEIFVKYYKKMCQYQVEDKLIEKLDLTNITYDKILKGMIEVIKAEERSQKKAEPSSTKQKSIKVADKDIKTVKEKNAKAVQKVPTTVKSDVLVTKDLNIVKEKKIKIAEMPVKNAIVSAKNIAVTGKNVAVAEKNIAAKGKNVAVAEKISAEQEAINKTNRAKELAKKQISNIVNNIEMTYYKLKTEEANIMDLANSTTVELNIDKINDSIINSNITSIKENSSVLRKRIEDYNMVDDLSYTNELLNNLNNLSSDQNITQEYSEEMKSIYTVCFNKNAQRLITDSKLQKLDKQRKEIESEKCSFFSKLLGKAKLKQARLDNINLKEQLILTESQFSSSSYYTIEDGLSDIYSYIKTEEDASCLTELNMYLRSIETNSTLREMTDQTKLSKKTKEKINQQRNLPQIALSKDKKRLFSKAQINFMQEKNNELKRVIQFNRANSLKLQNTGVIPIIGNIKSTKAVKKFMSNLNQIGNSMKSHSC